MLAISTCFLVFCLYFVYVFGGLIGLEVNFAHVRTYYTRKSHTLQPGFVAPSPHIKKKEEKKSSWFCQKLV